MKQPLTNSELREKLALWRWGNEADEYLNNSGMKGWVALGYINELMDIFQTQQDAIVNEVIGEDESNARKVSPEWNTIDGRNELRAEQHTTYNKLRGDK